ncbi:hypothetical protein BLNAU_2772 [Blattamonas nauphoetae]|uniref:Uncharacterized protein n=1 Tax=Blattamonas nauphoetae TaxID=2049346 RepID=A0ABQ9YEC5_9EUKA|nr:hypothetical protein BLNAU_2772 [Blattamonas nauphoetae]
MDQFLTSQEDLEIGQKRMKIEYSSHVNHRINVLQTASSILSPEQPPLPRTLICIDNIDGLLGSLSDIDQSNPVVGKLTRSLQLLSRNCAAKVITINHVSNGKNGPFARLGAVWNSACDERFFVHPIPPTKDADNDEVTIEFELIKSSFRPSPGRTLQVIRRSKTTLKPEIIDITSPIRSPFDRMRFGDKSP